MPIAAIDIAPLFCICTSARAGRRIDTQCRHDDLRGLAPRCIGHRLLLFMAHALRMLRPQTRAASSSFTAFGGTVRIAGAGFLARIVRAWRRVAAQLRVA